MADAETKTKPTPEEPDRKVKAPNPTALKMKSEVSLDYWLNAPEGTEPEDLANADWWQNIARRLKTNTIVHVRPADGRWYGQFLVTSAADTWAKVSPVLLARTDARAEEDGDPTPMDKRFKIDHIATGWRVIHRDTGKVIKSGLSERGDAEKIVQAEANKRR